jgi:hypothetical protein
MRSGKAPIALVDDATDAAVELLPVRAKSGALLSYKAVRFAPGRRVSQNLRRDLKA